MLIFLDIDGTLLNNKNVIEQETIEIISRINIANEVILTSARKPSSIKLVANQLKIKEKIIVCYNGALILDDEKKISEYTLPINIVSNIINLAKKFNVSINIYNNNSWFARSIDDFVLKEAKIVQEKPLFIRNNVEKIIAHKILLMGPEKDLTCLKASLCMLDNLIFSSSKKEYLEITYSKATKKNAFDFLLKYLSCDIRNTLAIGDSYNDIELLKSAQIGIAMGNAPMDVKKIADYITLTNDENGVGYALMKYL